MKKGRKILGFLLALAMVATLASCGSANNAGSTEATAAGTTVAAATTAAAPDLMTPDAKYPEPITLTIVKTTHNSPNYPDGEGPTNNEMLDLIKERLNIQFKLLWQVDDKDYKNKLGLSIASGEIPDMFEINCQDNYLTFKQLVDSGALADLTEAYQKSAGDYMKQVINSYTAGNKLDGVTFNGKMYAYPDMGLGYNNNLLWVRKDWLDKLGLQPPKTLDDVKNVARAFIQKDPGGNGPGKTIGLVLNSTKPLGEYSNQFGAEPIANSVGAYPRQWMKDASGNVYYGSTAPEMKTALGILADMYKEGLIDHQFLTRKTNNDAQAVITDNKCGMFFTAWWAGWPLYDLEKVHPEAQWIALNAPLDADGKFKHNVPPPLSSVMVVSSKVAHPEALIKILNLEFNAFRGFDKDAFAKIKGLVDKNTSFQDAWPTADINLDMYDVLPKLGHKIDNYIKTGQIEWTPADDNAYNRTTADQAKAYAASKDPKDQNGWVAYTTRVISSTILDAPENVNVPQAYSYTTESMANVKPALDSLEDQMALQIITGEKPLSYFDEFVTKWKQMGGDKITQEVQAIVGK